MDSIEEKPTNCRLAQLRNAIKLSNPRIVRKILAEGVDINHKFSSNSSDDPNQANLNTPLHLAATKTSYENFQVLLDFGADMTIKNSEGFTALHLVVNDCLSKDDSESPSSPLIDSVFLAHMKSGNFVNPGDNNGVTHFHVACMSDNGDAVTFFLNNGVNVNHTVHQGAPLFPGFTPLHFAARFASLNVAEILVERGANAALKDARGMTPMHLLIQRKIAMLELSEVEEKLGDKKAAQALFEKIDNNEDVLRLLFDSDLGDDDRVDEFGMSMHHAVCTFGQSAVAARVLNQVLDVDAQIKLDSPLWPGYTMLHFAAHCNVWTMKLLLGKGANIQIKDINGVTPFDIFIKWCKIKDLQSIIDMIPSWKNITFSNGKTKLLDSIAAMESSDQFKAFLQKNVDDVNVYLPADSPLWPGSTFLHLSVIFAQRFADNNNSEKQQKVIQSSTPAEMKSDIVRVCLDFGASIISQDVRGRTALHLAFRSNKNKVIETLLQNHHRNANLVDDENLSHLHIACAMRNRWTIEEWLANGVNIDVNVVYKGNVSLTNVQPGWTPLHVTVFSNVDSSVAKMLLDRGADPYLMDNNGFTPIHLTLVSPRIDLSLSKLLLSLPDLRENVADNASFTLLHVASYFNDVSAVDRLLDLGSNLDAKSSLPRFQNCTPLHIAMINKSRAVVDTLVRRGADIFARRSNGSTPLSEVLTSKHQGRTLKSFVAALRSNEMLRRRAESEFGLTVLHVVCRAGHVDAIGDLLKKGADVNAKVRSDSPFWPGWTPLHVLVTMGIEVVYQKKQLTDFKAMLDILLEHGSQVTIFNANGDTALHMMLKKYPCNTGYIIINTLLSYQKDFSINPVNKDGLTHFHAACLANNLEAAGKFLTHDGINANRPINYFAEHYAGSTPLHLALNSNSKRYFGVETQLQMIDLLLKHKADLQAKDDHAYTPLHIAADCDPSCVDLLKKLIDNGADINAQTIDGKTAFEMILWSKEISVEEINFFIGRKYHINGCNPISDRGYLSIILNEKDITQRSKILKALMDAPNVVATDEMGRTAIHNIVSTNDIAIVEYDYVELIDKLAKLGCDVNEQDHSGMTALHLAMLFRNVDAITALLICGVDINIVDCHGKTAFSYILDPCTRCLARCNNTHDYIRKVLVRHIQKLKFFGLYVSELNKKLKSKTLKNEWIRFPDNWLDENIRQIKSIVIGPRGWTLYDFLKEHGAVDEYRTLAHADQTVIDRFFDNISYLSLYDLRYMYKVQYRQATVRGPLINPAIASITILLGLPDLCAEAIVWYLRNPDLKNVITAANSDL